MKLINKFAFLLIAFVFVLSSCTKENIDDKEIVIEEPETEVEVNPLVARSSGGDDGLLLDCFSIDYPFTIIDQDDVTYTVASEDDFITLMEDEDLILVDFVYPLNITYDDDETDVIADEEALVNAFTSCIPDGGWEDGDFPAYNVNDENSCYTLVFPLDLEDTDGNLVTANDENEFNTLLSEDLYFFVFPINLEHEDGSQVTVNASEELFETLFSCSGWEPYDSTFTGWEDGFEYIGCYMIAFPLDVVTSNGDVVTVNNHQELCDLMLQGAFVDYAYPLSLIDEDGVEIVVNTEEELFTALQDCGIFIGTEEGLIILLSLASGSYYDDCYTINYPIEILFVDGSSMSINSEEELEASMSNPDVFPIDMELPVNVTMVADGSVVEINNLEDLFQVLETCQ